MQSPDLRHFWYHIAQCDMERLRLDEERKYLLHKIKETQNEMQTQCDLPESRVCETQNIGLDSRARIEPNIQRKIINNINAADIFKNLL